MSSSLGSERYTVLGAIDPDAYTANTYTTAWIDMASYDRIMAVVLVGTLNGSGTFNAKLQKALTDGGTPVDISGKLVTALTGAGTDSDKQAILNLRADELGPNDGYRYVRLSITSAQTNDFGALVLGLNGRYGGAGFMTALGSEQVAVVGSIDPDVYAAGDVSTGWVDISRFGRVMGIVFAGTTGVTNTIAGKLEQATTSGGAGVKDVTGAAATTVDGTVSPTEADVQRTVDCSADDLDIEGGFRYVRLTMTVSDTTSPETATSDAAGVLLGFDTRYAPASGHDAASVDEIVAA